MPNKSRMYVCESEELSLKDFRRVRNFKTVQTPGMNPQPSGPLSHSLVAYFWDVNLYEVLPRHSGIKGYCFGLAARCAAIGGLCTGIRQKVVWQTGIRAFLPRQEATAVPGKLLLGESYQTDFVLPYGTKAENFDGRCFWLMWRPLCWRSQGRRLAKRSSFSSFTKMMCMCPFQQEQTFY